MPETTHQLTLPLETHRNHYLFSDHYLNELLPRQAPWREAEAEAQQALEAITAKYHEVADALPHYHEAAAEKNLTYSCGNSPNMTRLLHDADEGECTEIKT